MDCREPRAVILTGAFRDIGVGVVAGDDYADVEGPVWSSTLDAGRRTRK